MISKPLETYHEAPVVSPNSGREYHPGRGADGKWSCDCEAGKHKRTCLHIALLLLRQEKAKTGYLQETHGWSNEAVETFEEVAERCLRGDEFNEAEWVRKVILKLGAEGKELTADDVYEAVGGKFIRDPRLLGSVIGLMRREGVLKPLGYVASSRNAGRPVVRWVLSSPNP